MDPEASASSSASWWIVITKDGKPLRTESGTVLLFTSAEDAQCWTIEGETVAQAEAGIAGAAAIDFDR